MSVVVRGSVKLAEEVAEEHDRGILRRVAPAAIGLGAGTLLSAGGLIAATPALRSEFLYRLRSLGAGKQNFRKVPNEAKVLSKKVADKLRELGVDPTRHRVAISGLGGSGKTTLAKGLHEELRFANGPQNLDWLPLSIIGRRVDRAKIIPGAVYEQTHVLRQADPEDFDYVVHLDKPQSELEARLMQRGRAGASHFLNYDKLRDSLRVAFGALGGELHEIEPGVYLKARPASGWGAADRLKRKLVEKGIDPTGLSREQQILSLVEGRRATGRGALPYIRHDRLATGAGVIGTGAIGGAIGGEVLGNRYSDE
jgi:hypothetical protein